LPAGCRAEFRQIILRILGGLALTRTRGAISQIIGGQGAGWAFVPGPFKKKLAFTHAGR